MPWLLYYLRNIRLSYGFVCRVTTWNVTCAQDRSIAVLRELSHTRANNLVYSVNIGQRVAYHVGGWELTHTVSNSLLGPTAMSHKVLETDFPLMVPPNPPLSVHPNPKEQGRSGSLKRAYEGEECEPLAPRGSPEQSETSDYQSECHPPFRPPTFR